MEAINLKESSNKERHIDRTGVYGKKASYLLTKTKPCKAVLFEFSLNYITHELRLTSRCPPPPGFPYMGYTGMFQALALRRSESRNRGLCVVYIQKDGATLLVGAW